MPLLDLCVWHTRRLIQTEKHEEGDLGGSKGCLTAWEFVGTWDGPCQSLTPSESSVPSATEEPKQYAVTIQLATDAYLSNCAGRGIAPATVRKYKTFVNQLLTFVADKGYVMIDQIQITDMDEFYSRWKDGIRAKGKKLERLNGFFKFCVKRKWIGENPAADLEAPVGAGTAANRMPFTDAELVRIYEACDRLRDVDWKNHLGSGSWGGDDVKSMVMLLSWTGLRIGDAATFDMNRVTPHPDGGANVFANAQDKRSVVHVGSDWLYERLLARERKYGSRIFAFVACPRDWRRRPILWRRRINRAFDLAGAFEHGTPTPHIFRHTFVRLLLQRGVSPRDVADLIGDTEEVVVKHYAVGTRAAGEAYEHSPKRTVNRAKAKINGNSKRQIEEARVGFEPSRRSDDL